MRHVLVVKVPFYLDVFQSVHLVCHDAFPLDVSLVLHELEDELADKMMTEAIRVLDDNGEIIVTEWEPSKSSLRKIIFAPIHFLEPKLYRSFVKKNMYEYFGKYGLWVEEFYHTDYTKVLVLKKSGNKSDEIEG